MLIDAAAALLVLANALRRWRMLSACGACVVVLLAGALLIFGIAGEGWPDSWPASAMFVATVLVASAALWAYRRYDLARSRAFA